MQREHLADVGSERLESIERIASARFHRDGGDGMAAAGLRREHRRGNDGGRPGLRLRQLERLRPHGDDHAESRTTSAPSPTSAMRARGFTFWNAAATCAY